MSAPVTTTLDNRLLVRARKLIERNVHRNFFRAAELFQLRHGPLMLRLGPWLDRAVLQRQAWIRNDEIEIESDRVSKTLTRWTRAVRIVEAEQTRLGRRVDRVVVFALEPFGEPQLFGVGIGSLDHGGPVTLLKTDFE